MICLTSNSRSNYSAPLLYHEQKSSKI